MLAVAWSGHGPTDAVRGDDPPLVPSKVLPQARAGGVAAGEAGAPKLWAMVGHILSVDRRRQEYRIDFGRAAGAEAGMTLIALRATARQDEEWRLAWLDVASVGERECTARLIERTNTFADPRDPEAEVRPGDVVRSATDRESFQLIALANGEVAAGPGPLLRARKEVAQRWLEVAGRELDLGRISLDRYIAASRALMAAESESAGSQSERIAAFQAHLLRMNVAVAREADRMKEGSGSMPNSVEAQYAQVEAALWLARARREPAGSR
jgi:hypothetical protein